MNLVGKILVVLNLVMSIVFMSLALMVYATHRDWRDAVENPQTGYKVQIERKNAEIATLNQTRAQLQRDFDRARNEHAHAIAQLTSRLDESQRQLATLQATYNDQVRLANEAQLQLKATTEQLQAQDAEIARLRKENDDVKKDRDAKLAELTQSIDELANLRFEVKRLRDRHLDLESQLTMYMVALADAGIQLDRSGPPRLEGVVLASSSEGFVEISLGSDDGLEKGHTLDVFSIGSTPETSRFLGKIEIVRTDTSKSVARVLREFQKGPIRRGDRVATRLGELKPRAQLGAG